MWRHGWPRWAPRRRRPPEAYGRCPSKELPIEALIYAPRYPFSIPEKENGTSARRSRRAVKRPITSELCTFFGFGQLLPQSSPKEVYPMLHSVLAAHRAELIQCPEQQAFEFADCPAPAADRWAALPMRCPGRENYLLWQAEFALPSRPARRLCLEITVERPRGAVLSHRLKPVQAA